MAEVTAAALKRQASEFRFVVFDWLAQHRKGKLGHPFQSFEHIVAQGQHLETQLAAAQATCGAERDYQAARQIFWHCFGDLYNERLDFGALRRGDAANCDYAQKACACYKNSGHPLGASGLARIFRGVGFYGSALHWYDITERVAKKAGQADAGLAELGGEAATTIQSLWQNKTTSDPALTPGLCFPTRDTPGLIPPTLPPVVQVKEPAPGASQDQQARFRALEEQRKIEREHENRLGAGLCLTCGHALRVADKMARRRKHKECA